jgi:hypothetical protein
MCHKNEEKTRWEQDKTDYTELKIIEGGMKRKIGLPALLILRHQEYVTDRQTDGEGGLEFDEIQSLTAMGTTCSVRHT